MERFIAAQKRAHRLETGERLIGARLLAELDRLDFPYELANEPAGEYSDLRYLVFQADQEKVLSAVKGKGQDIPLWIEREIIYRTADELNIDVRSVDGDPIQECTLSVVMSQNGNGSHVVNRKASPAGRATVSYDPAETVHRVEAHAAGYWPTVSQTPNGHASLRCPRLPIPKLSVPDRRLAWWHHAVGIDDVEMSLGSQIRVGIVDTTVGPHSALDQIHREGGWTNNLKFQPQLTLGHSHGTHVCGIIAASPASAGYVGIAPGVELHAVAVEENPSQVAIARGITRLVEDHDVHLINVSMEAKFRSPALLEAIEDALAAGCLVFAAAGNLAGRVLFPAQHDEVIAISAFGKIGAYPANSVCEMYEQDGKPQANGYFFAPFSCWGAEVNCCAPGVGIISTAPSRFSDSWGCENGTSMASPIACGVLAAVLSQQPAYLALKSPQKRVSFARKALQKACRSNGWHATLEGSGIPCVS